MFLQLNMYRLDNDSLFLYGQVWPLILFFSSISLQEGSAKYLFQKIDDKYKLIYLHCKDSISGQQLIQKKAGFMYFPENKSLCIANMQVHFGSIYWEGEHPALK